MKLTVFSCWISMSDRQTDRWVGAFATPLCERVKNIICNYVTSKQMCMKTRQNFRSTCVSAIRISDYRFWHWSKKVKQSHYRLGKALRVPGGWGFQISRQSAHEGSKAVSPTHQLLLPPGNVPGTHFCYSPSQPQSHSAAGRIMSMEIPVTPSGIKPATCRFVAKCLNQLRHQQRAPWHWSEKHIKLIFKVKNNIILLSLNVI
jgi:hypothetical protein